MNAMKTPIATAVFAFLLLPWSGLVGIAGAEPKGNDPADAVGRPGSAAVASFARHERGIDFTLVGGGVVRLDVLTGDMVRLRASPSGKFAQSLPIQWGYVKDDWPAAAFQVQEAEGAVVVRAAGLVVRVARGPFAVEFQDSDGRTLTRTIAPAAEGAGSQPSWLAAQPALNFEMPADEHFFGLGFQRVSLDCRGQKLLWARRFRHKEATVPFFMSTRGYAFYSNSTWEHTFDFTQVEPQAARPPRYTVAMDGGEVDFYVIRGPKFRDLLDRYTQLTGRPELAPRWTMGLHYICRYFEPQQAVLRIAEEFRRRDIPRDMIGLEPGWESVPYSNNWRWSKTRFPDPKGMISQLARMGYRFELWEEGNAPAKDYTDPAVRRAWYAKRVPTSVDIGVKFFKQDDPYPRMIVSEELQAPVLGKLLGPSGGRTSRELLNVANTLYSETAFQEYRRLTGQRAFIIFSGYASSIASHRWPTAWAGDFAATHGLLNAGLSGHAMASLDMNGATLPGIHYGYLTPFSIVDSWAYYNEPWLRPDHIEQAHRFYSKLKHRLAPYLYSTLHQASHSGVPMMRAMVLDLPDDPNTWNLSSQHMLGDWLLVGSGPSVYLPPGRWVNYWTGERHQSAGQWQKCAFDEPQGGPLLVHSGAIVPTEPVTPSLGQEPADLIEIDVFPDRDATAFTLIEDDGASYAYQSGATAATEIRCRATDDAVRIDVGARTGDYTGKPAARTYLVMAHVGVEPEAVEDGEKVLPRAASRAALLHDADRAGWYYDADEGIAWIKPDAGWRLDFDERGAKGDPERDTLRWTAAAAERPAGRATSLLLHVKNAGFSERPRRPAAVETPLEPDRLFVVANPPERVALRSGDWLAMKSNFYVSVRCGNQTVPTATNEVRLEVLDAQGKLVYQARKTASRGRVEFLGIDYVPEKYLFRFTSPGLKPCETRIRKAPPIARGR
jgi:alpha-glucosidase (family GH31 glycosyl hydrolase)